uniref:Lon protease homolog n=1 Tax=Plectus sambesii TaxID=2011161 RepID=A0A914W2L4_9BILA
MPSVQVPKKLPILMVTDGVVFPAATMRIPIRSKQNILMLEQRILSATSLHGSIVVIAYRDATADKSSSADDSQVEADGRVPKAVHTIATAAIVTQVMGSNWPQPSYTVQVTGLCRVRLDRIVRQQPFLLAAISQLDKIDDIKSVKAVSEAALKEFTDDVWKILNYLSPRDAAVQQLRKIVHTASLDVICDLTASVLKEVTYTELLRVLDHVTIAERLAMVHSLVKRQLKVMEHLSGDDESYTVQIHPESTRVDDISRLLGSIINRKAVGGRDGDMSERNASNSTQRDALLQKLKDAKMPPDVEKDILKEYQKLKGMSNFSPEYNSLQNYLELVADLPWSTESGETLNVQKSRADLDADHYGLKVLKTRILEYLAVRQLRRSLKGPILCFVGPPGVGKTSVAKSIANTLGRTFHRVALGGISDESDIRGHRRTYIGSMPGRIIQGMKTAKTKNPVFLLDEVDKLTSGVHGDPSSALLEVLDPEQNNTFLDHYLNVPFDLSGVLFIATANNVSGIPAPLLDRMEMIEIAGYTQEEKVRIAMDHLIPKQLREHGIDASHVHLPADSIAIIVQRYTREAGVRNLERSISAICRAVALKIAEAQSSSASSPSADSTVFRTDVGLPALPIVIDDTALTDILGPATHANSGAEILVQPGVAAGLAWTPVGGEVLYVETTKMEGEGRVTLTGQLGDVMKESANLALTWLRSHVSTDMKRDLIEKTDVHVHFPAGAVSKDGPSAGITVLVALASLFTNRCVRSDTAMTGEVTLRGLLLPVGGIRDKVLAAYRAGFRRVILPKRNEKDIIDIPEEIKKSIEFVFATTMAEALNAAFEGGFQKLQSNAASKL